MATPPAAPSSCPSASEPLLDSSTRHLHPLELALGRWRGLALPALDRVDQLVLQDLAAAQHQVGLNK